MSEQITRQELHNELKEIIEKIESSRHNLREEYQKYSNLLEDKIDKLNDSFLNRHNELSNKIDTKVSMTIFIVALTALSSVITIFLIPMQSKQQKLGEDIVRLETKIEEEMGARD
jgi:hypothetical protein